MVEESKLEAARSRLMDPIVAGWGGCWIFTGLKNHHGYGSMTGPVGATVLAHRFAYELFVGPVPEGLILDHLCRVRHCVNPRHLEAVTVQVNNLRGESFSAINARKTHCVNGHEFTPANTYFRTPTHRQCRACNSAQVAAYKARRSSHPAV